MEIIFENEQVKWINLHNPSNKELTDIANEYNFLKLTIEDSLEPGHLPKFESNGNISFLLTRYYEKSEYHQKNIVREFSYKISLYYGQNFIITTHQKDTKIFNQIKAKYLTKVDSNKITRKEITYLIIMETIKSFESPAEQMDEKIDELEAMVFSNDIDKLKLQTLYTLKREASACRKILDYTLESLKEYSNLNNKTSSLQDLIEDTQKMLHLHTQIIEDVQNLLSIYLSLNSQRSNEIMKTLTIFSAFFLPLTFIVGVYGMNFKYMPELNLKYGYPISLVTMLTIVAIIFIWFKKKKFL